MRCLFGLLLLCLFSCRSVKTVTRETIDSTYVKKSDSLSREISSLKENFQKELSEAKRTGIIFATPCPDVNIDSACSKDSMIKLINQQREYISSLKNSVKINKDGSIEATGKLKAAYVNMDKIDRQAGELMFNYQKEVSKSDSLREELKKRITGKKTKTSFPWFWLIVGLALGFLLRSYLWPMITLLIKKLQAKNIF